MLARESGAELVARLSAANGWERDTAQRLLVERNDLSVVPALQKLAANAADPRAQRLSLHDAAVEQHMRRTRQPARAAANDRPGFAA